MTLLDNAITKIQSNSQLTIVVCSNDSCWTSSRKGVQPLLDLIDSDIDTQKMVVADRVVGRAAALLYVYMGISEVYAELISSGAKLVLDSYQIPYRFNKEVPMIINREGTDMCPMEKATQSIDDPKLAIIAIKNKLMELAGK